MEKSESGNWWGGNPTLFENLKSLNLGEPPFITKKAERRIKPN